MEVFNKQPGESRAQRIGRWILGGTMVFAGLSHMTFARLPFREQVPEFAPRLLPLTVDQIVVWSGVAEASMGTSLLLLPRQRKVLGWTLATFFIAILPGNLAQWRHHRTAFGLDTDQKRFWRLFAQPGPVLLALWSTGALDGLRKRNLPR